MRTADLSHAKWRKSSRSNGGGGACVEIAATKSVAGIRDSKDPAGPALVVTSTAFAALVDAVKTGRLDLS
ncbi:DUF397 domain-containing protein [Streptoalloteichus hindustanus]|uniref:DUF397 domain-containing protein n=1 Tax=Streptoalloteichus hindustanus TaxID=2017 RepID=A0A1M4XP45_STRHI|nr:DUF397 domain-containing protein [Streptoalloteichus hindustanus]SHE95279.1 protein of unknown function [Streptoalloteichus hindustanus]